MNGPQAKRVVVGSMLAAGGLAASSQLVHGDAPRLRIFIGAMAGAVMLSMLAEVAPDLAGMFALLALTTAVFTAGAGTFDAIRRIFE